MGRILTEKEMESVSITPDAFKSEMKQLSEKNANKKVTAGIANDGTNFDKYLIDMTKPVVKPSSLFSIKESIPFSRGNISVIRVCC